MNSDFNDPGEQLTISEGSRVFIIPSEKELANEYADVAKEQPEIDLLAYWQIFKKNRAKILGLTLLIGLLTTLVSFLSQPIYQSTTRLLIEFDKVNVISIEEISASNLLTQEYLYTQLEIIKSRILAAKVVDRLNLLSHPAFDFAKQPQGFSIDWYQWLPSDMLPPKKPITDEDIHRAIVNAVMGGLSINFVPQTRIVEISFDYPDAGLAAKIPNTLADVYIESDLESKLAMTNKAASWLTERLDGLRQQLRNAEKKLQDYMEHQNIIDVAGIKSVAVKELEETATNLFKARLQLADTKRVYRQVRTFQTETSDNFESIPAILNNSLVQNLKQAELLANRKVYELKERYGEKHPDIIAAKAELDVAIANKATQIKLTIEGIRKEYEMAAAKVKSLEGALKAKKAKIQVLNRQAFQLRILEREVEVNRQLYDLFLTRFKETNASQDIQALQSTIARIIEQALVAPWPYKPNKERTVIVGLVLGFFLSILLAFFIEYLDNTIKNSEEVEQKLGLPLLGILPKIKVGKKEEEPDWLFLKKPKSQFSESVRSICTGIMLSAIDNPQKLLIVTSSVPSEGKTTLSISQAFALGQMEKTLLIDADMRRPSIAHKLGWSTNPPAPGLSELVAGRRTLEECIHHVAEKVNVDIIPCGEIPPNPLELLSSERFKKLLEQLSQKYKYIVIDSAPIMLVSDTLVVAKFATEVIYVVRANATPCKVVLDGLKRLRQVEVPVRNIVLNFVDTKKTSNYYYHKYGYQKGYYNEQGADYGYYSK
jgi:capsular exopolysaccharide synthesis family protein